LIIRAAPNSCKITNGTLQIFQVKLHNHLPLPSLFLGQQQIHGLFHAFSPKRRPRKSCLGNHHAHYGSHLERVSLQLLKVRIRLPQDKQGEYVHCLDLSAQNDSMQNVAENF
jgi:hypothetical protein